MAGVLPDESATITPIGGSVEISDEYVPAAMFEYALSDRFSVELFCCVAPHEVTAVQTQAGNVDLGEVTLFPPTVTLKYHFFQSAPVQPYLGAGVNITAFFNEDAPEGISIDYDTTVGPAIQAGVNIPFNDRWFANIDVKKIWIEPEVSINGGAIQADVEINPIVGFIGVGYRF